MSISAKAVRFDEYNMWVTLSDVTQRPHHAA